MSSSLLGSLYRLGPDIFEQKRVRSSIKKKTFSELSISGPLTSLILDPSEPSANLVQQQSQREERGRRGGRGGRGGGSDGRDGRGGGSGEGGVAIVSQEVIKEETV